MLAVEIALGEDGRLEQISLTSRRDGSLMSRSEPG
jgi:hypothetical protein